MAGLATIKIDLNKIDKSKIFNAKSGAKYYEFQIAINDTTSQYGENISASEVQTKEQRDAKENKTFIGGGKVVWTNGEIKVAERVERENFSSKKEEEADDLPF